MKKENFKGLINGIKKTIIRKSPEILVGIGIAGMVTTTVLAVKATPKALELIREKEEELGVEKLTAGETVKTAWKCYIPAVATCALSTACIISSSTVHSKRNAAIAAAYELSQKALVDYKDAVIETIGEKKEQIVKEKIAENRLKEDPVSKKEVILTGKGSTLCYESLSGRYFESDMESIKHAVNALNAQMLDDMYVSLNDFYDLIGLSYTDMGEKLGWSIDDGLVETSFSAKTTDDGQLCLVLDYSIQPKYNFDRFS